MRRWPWLLSNAGILTATVVAAALLLAIRRQLLAETAHELAERNHQIALQAQAHTETDAAERRVTDLYTTAVEQLGSADAAVRLGGLYDLERVAQNNPAQRQTIVNVLCAYLRIPQHHTCHRQGQGLTVIRVGGC